MRCKWGRSSSTLTVVMIVTVTIDKDLLNGIKHPGDELLLPLE